VRPRDVPFLFVAGRIAAAKGSDCDSTAYTVSDPDAADPIEVSGRGARLRPSRPRTRNSCRMPQKCTSIIFRFYREFFLPRIGRAPATRRGVPAPATIEDGRLKVVGRYSVGADRHDGVVTTKT